MTACANGMPHQTKPLLDAGIDAWWDDEGESYYSCYYWWNRHSQLYAILSGRMTGILPLTGHSHLVTREWATAPGMEILHQPGMH